MLERDTTKAGTSVLFAYELTRDSLQRVVTRTELVRGVHTTYAYAYDSTGRLSEVRRDGQVVAAYEYDQNGNRTTFVSSDGSVTGSYNAHDRLLSYGAATYAFSDDGQLLAKIVGSDSTRYRYDLLGNLRSVTLPDGTVVEYVIDALNRRVAKKVNGVVVQRFLYAAGLGPAAELNAAGQVTTRYVYGSRLTVPEYMVRNGTTYRFVTDYVGSVRLVVDVASGIVAQRIDYDEFGRVVADSNPNFQPFGYAGGLYDAQIGLVRFGARDYGPETGRWTGKDPIGFAGGDANLYAYVANDPINYVDPLGLCPEWLAAAAAVTFSEDPIKWILDKIRSMANPTYDSKSKIDQKNRAEKLARELIKQMGKEPGDMDDHTEPPRRPAVESRARPQKASGSPPPGSGGKPRYRFPGPGKTGPGGAATIFLMFLQGALDVYLTSTDPDPCSGIPNCT